MENSFAKYIESKNQDIMKKRTETTISFFPAIIIMLTVFSLTFISLAYAQDKAVWHNKKCAIVLTYDDALNVHLDNVIPALDSLDLKATFYIPASFPNVKTRAREWSKIAAKGHELGNHTLFHPCEGKAYGREWVPPTYDLSAYTLERINGEIKMANTLLELLDGRTRRTFAYTCGDTKAGDSSFIPTIKNLFAGARGVEGKMQKLNDIDLYNIGSYMINGQSGKELIDIVKTAMEKNSLLVFLFHGVGGEHDINVTLDAHSKLLHFLKQNEKDIWVAPFIDAVEYIKTNQKTIKP